MAEMHEWERMSDEQLSNEIAQEVLRMKVPGGYLYEVLTFDTIRSSAPVHVTLAFVPSGE